MENNLHFFFFFNIVGKQQSRLRPLVDAVKKELAYMWNASGSEISKFQHAEIKSPGKFVWKLKFVDLIKNSTNLSQRQKNLLTFR